MSALTLLPGRLTNLRLLLGRSLLRKWRGDSSLETYARVVVTNLGREYRILLWGRWRPSAAALRLGRVAILLEQLVYRDGMRLQEAYEQLRTRGEGDDMTDAELSALFRQIPVRPRSRRGREAEEPVDAVADEGGADDMLVVDERDTRFREVVRVLRRAVATLPPDQRVLIELHFFKALKISDVARTLGVEQKPLYRERDRALATLARLLGAAGIGWEEVRDLFGGDLPPPADRDDPDERHAPDDPDTRDNEPPRPSNES